MPKWVSDSGLTYFLNKVKNWCNNTFAKSSHSHTKSQITDFPSSLPASDVYGWAKTSTKPSYTASEVGALSSSGGSVSGEISTNAYSRLTGYGFLNNVNLNDYRYTGQYGVMSNCANRPSTNYSYGILEVIMYSTSWLLQRYTAINDSGSVSGVWYRTYRSGNTWSAWIKYDLGPTVVTATVG